MIVRERDKKQLMKSIAVNEDRISCIKNEIDDLESELNWREDDLDTDKRKLAMMNGDEDEFHVLAREKPRPKCEAKLTVFMRDV